MSEYKLVPVEPTDEMVSAAEDAYMPFGDMEMAIRMAALAAPAVQGEPVATVEVMPDGSQVWIALKTQWLPVGLHKLYTTPQPAERQEFKRFNGEECWLWAGDGSDRLETLTCPVVIKPAELMAIINRVAPAPDVAGLVEALERSVAGFVALSGMVSLDSGARNYARLKALELNAVIAAHRKQGGV